MSAEEALNGGGAAVPAIGDVVADKYRIEARLGQGGMGVVFAATHLVTAKRVALKWLVPRRGQSADDLERFVREARAAGRIHHPGVVDVYDVGEHAGAFFLVMELLEGRPLRAWLDQGPLEAGALLATLLPAMRGVQSAHARGVVHRDLKPDNLFICTGMAGEPLHAKVLDFGISKLEAQRELGEGTLTESGVVLGTPHYMAPEQAEDSKSVDHRVDVYAFGVVLYEALSGVKPYQAQSLTSLLLQVARGQHQPLATRRPDLPRELLHAVTKAMARDPGDRFLDMGAMIAAIEAFASAPTATLLGLGADAMAFSTTLSAGRAQGALRRRRQLKLAAATALALLLAGVLAYALRNRAAPDAPVIVEHAVVPPAAPAAEPKTAVPAAPATAAAAATVAPPTAAPLTETPTGTARPTTTRQRPRGPAAKPVATASTPANASTDAGQPAHPTDRKGRLSVKMDSDQF